MPPATPPPTTYDHKPAYDYRDAMLARADGELYGSPAWHGWALVEAYMAGRAAKEAEIERESVKPWERFC